MSRNDFEKSRPPMMPWIDLLLALCVVLLLLGLRHFIWGGEDTTVGTKRAQSSSATSMEAMGPHHFKRSSAERESAEAIVARKLSQFAQKEGGVFEALAAKRGVTVPEDVRRFFAAMEAGRLDEAKALYQTLMDHNNPVTQAKDVLPLMRAVRDAWGAAMMSQRMPAQEYLDYGNAILGSLKPGMIYVGGTDPGLFIPNMLNATSDGEQHIVLTQNALADASYLDYLNELYGNQVKTLTADDAKQAFQDYAQDAQKRLLHDQQFPDEPKQILPGENVSTDQDGHVSVGSQVGVMAINGLLLQTFMQNNPDASFGLEESFPLKSTYAGAVPLGPIMQLGGTGSSGAFSADTAAQTVAYLQNSTQQLLANPEAAGSADTLLTYAHDAVAQANLLAAHDYSAEAEQAYNLATQLAPTNFEAVAGLSDVLYRNGQADQAIQILNDFAQKNPGQQNAVNLKRSLFTAK